MSLKKILNDAVIHKYQADGLISVNYSYGGNLRILNYTPETQYSKKWDEITLNCRGLIIDDACNIIHRPFPKFFNIEEVAILPNGIPKVYDKLDGMLGILYWEDDTPKITTRGLFNSTYANYATSNLLPKYSDHISKFDKEKTYLFEIIYPDNRILVDYEGKEDLTLLAVRDNEGNEYDIADIDFPNKAKIYPEHTIETIKELNTKNAEGFVLLYPDGTRLKYKFSDYKRLARAMMGISNLTVHDYLAKHRDINELIAVMPDEFYAWIKHTEHDLINAFLRKKAEIIDLYNGLNMDTDRKSIAIEIKKNKKYAGYLFHLLNGKSIDEYVWKDIRPKREEPKFITKQ